MRVTQFYTKGNFLVLFFLLVIFQSYAQRVRNIPQPQDLPSIQVNKIDAPIQLDGQLLEAVWSSATPAQNFQQYFPSDSTDAFGDTHIYMAYDNKNLYIAIECFTNGNNFVTTSLRRDYDFRGNDNITLMFDTYQDQTNALAFGINAYGVKREALVRNAGQGQWGGFDLSWDNKWSGVAKMQDSSWTAEMIIPFKTLRFKEGMTQWRFNAFRYDSQLNEITSWISIPRNLQLFDLGFMGNMNWAAPLNKPGNNVSLIPYASTIVSRDYNDPDQTEASAGMDIGGDAKIAITPALQLDLTVNPDFSQVEVDRQVTNLQRFELFFPERRQFFLENSDLFSHFSIGAVTPFFSRRIGLSIDTTTGQNIQNTILYGARLNGKLNERLRVGLLNMQTAKQEENDLPGFNYTVAAIEQQVFSRSRVAVSFINKQAINSDDFGETFNDYNRVFSAEYRLASADNRWKGKLNYQRSFSPNIDEAEDSHFFSLIYRERRYRLEWTQFHVGNGFNAETGFVARKDYFLYSPEAAIYFFPKKHFISQHVLSLDLTFIHKLSEGSPYIDAGALEQFTIRPAWDFRFVNFSRLLIRPTYTEFTLLEDFDPTRLQEPGVVLDAGKRVKFAFLDMLYQSDRRKVFSFNARPNVGQFYTGFRAGMQGEFTYRYQPLGFVSLSYNYNYIDLGGEFEAVDTWLLGPRFDLTFTKNIFLTTFVQYNNQLDNLNINARFQWRYRPASDFYLVYTDNYETELFNNFGKRNRAIVAKVTYWLNL
ncbi:MAG: DUF5916 domain-containing protein [Bacteroidota bacterium]